LHLPKSQNRDRQPVSIAHNACVHGCTIEDDVLIGIGAIILDDAVIGTGSVIAAGAIVLPGTKVEPGSIYAGIPAKKVKDTGPEMKAVIERRPQTTPCTRRGSGNENK